MVFKLKLLLSANVCYPVQMLARRQLYKKQRSLNCFEVCLRNYFFPSLFKATKKVRIDPNRATSLNGI